MTLSVQDLPKIKGDYSPQHPLASMTTIKVGGPAEVWADFLDMNDLSSFVKNLDKDIPLTFVGEGSNMVIRDGGLLGVVTHLGKWCADVQVEGRQIYVQAGATCGKLARTAREAGLSGVEFYAGIPGGIGGALRMNAGCYGVETADRLVSVDVLDDQGGMQTLKPEDLHYHYRHSELPDGWVFIGARYQLVEGDKAAIRDEMRRINHERKESQPLEFPSSGSWFKNVVQGDGSKLNAWRIVDAAGCRGWRIGDAQVSEKHCNFFINRGEATAADLLLLTERVEAEVLRTQGIVMRREVRFVGVEVE